jgi:CheY-like chemotaxis protein
VVLALSGYVTEHEQEKITECGFDGFISKPASAEILQQAIEVAFNMAKKRARDQGKD